jgi:hypothetical protein
MSTLQALFGLGGIGRKRIILSQENRRPSISAKPLDDPKRPPDYRPLDPFWMSQGFVKHPELVGTIAWQEIGEKEETPKPMVFWIKNLSSH